MAHTFGTGRKVELQDAGQLLGKGALELASRLRSWEPLEASLGLAALNSMIEPAGEPGNVLGKILDLARDKTVTIIGRFPFNVEVAEVAARSFLLEMDPRGEELPASAAEEVIPQSDLNVITATALMNKTLPRLLELGRDATHIVLGPRTPMNDVLFHHGAGYLAGIRVVDSNALAGSIMQGVKSFRRLAGIEPLVRTT
jgi:uncharacterized protein (DUF4213/DUF364 family)